MAKPISDLFLLVLSGTHPTTVELISLDNKMNPVPARLQCMRDFPESINVGAEMGLESTFSPGNG
jgi:hypothetical protein